MKGRLPNRTRLEHSLDALESVDEFVAGMTFDAFASDLKITFAVVKALEIVGEATYHVTDEIR
ncbi:HepT-like ribonuclease domain-containing protein [Spirosoma aerolatum]|uniref:HepT-like ribonuclease domain-containing protein n=1 Tax=Spirosoma aerolatum TaxID=1211326 RepID=UPI0009ACED21|nr:HepT-like ribonuclease domain-containing protein [Spirosoma aerolatum]